MKSMLKRKEPYIYLDIDKPYFIKPQSHYILYRRSASGRHFHLKFKRSWLTTNEIAELIKQADPNWLAYCIAQGKLRIAAIKKGNKATEWKRTEMPTPILVLRGCGEINARTKYGYALISNGYLETEWEKKARKEMSELYKLMPKPFKNTAERDYSYDEYDDWDESDFWDDGYDEF